MTENELKAAQQYEATVIAPAAKSSPQFLLCPVGLVGAGKTTVIKPLAERLSLVRISGDEIRMFLKENGCGYENMLPIAAMVAKKYLAQGHGIAIDSDCAGNTGQKLIADVQAKMGLKAVWIHINPPESFIISKLRNFKHTWLFKDGEEAVENYIRRKPLHTNLTMPFVYTFDTSRDDIGKQIDKAEKIIRQEIKPI
ncbi:MAG TPA: AAA family ATPase [Candidatus Paceibacterota bacterium]